MPGLKKVVEKVLLPLQLSLGLFQIMKTTPLWAVVHCTLAYLLHCICFPYTDYKQLEGFQGRVFKKVIAHATTPGDVSKVKKQKDPMKFHNSNEITEKSENGGSVSVEKEKDPKKSENGGSVSMELDYLGKKFVLERMEGNNMLLKFGNIKDRPAYYITEEMWETVQYIEKVAKESVFVKNHKEIWEEVVTGDIMEFEEVLDSVILDNRAVVRLDHDYFLPVNLLLVEDKLQRSLNFVGLFLQTQKHIHWLIPASLSFTSAVMGFSTTVRLCIVCFINTIVCRAVQWVCDLLPLPMRRRVYYYGSWLERLKPSNDLQSKIVRGDIDALVAGGAKVRSQSLSEQRIFAEPSVHEICSEDGPFLFKCESKRNSVYIEWIRIVDNKTQKCFLKAGRVASKEASLLKSAETYIVFADGDNSTKTDIEVLRSKTKESLIADDIDTASVDIECSTEEEAIKLFIFAAYMAKLKSGSLRSYDRNTNTVYVRRFVESINAYVRSGYPPLYKLELKGVVVR